MSTPEQREKWRRNNSAPAAIERRREYRTSAAGKEKARLRQSERRDELRENERNRRYGLKPGEWDVIFAAQGSKCAICCRTEHVGKHWHTDHCHATGRVRGILCHHCNHMLGGAQDNPANLLAAVRYLNAGV